MAAWTGPCLILTLAVCLTFGQVLRHDFVEWDDQINVTGNPHLTELSWRSVGRFWREPYFTRYTPVSYTIYAAEAWLAPLTPNSFGKPALNPAVFHAGSLLLHLACVLLVYRLMVLFVGDGLPACLGALLFAVHPLQAESVSWVSGQGGLVSAMFSLVALLLYAQCRLGHSDAPGEKQSSLCGTAFYLAATLAYVAALLSKPSAACVPLLAVLLDRCWLKRSWRTSALLLGPWCLLAVGMFLITSREQSGDTSQYVPPLALRFLIAGDALSFYLSKLFWPVELIIQYPRSPRIVLAGRWVYFAWLVPASLLALAFHFRSRGPWLLFGGFSIAASRRCWA